MNLRLSVLNASARDLLRVRCRLMRVRCRLMRVRCRLASCPDIATHMKRVKEADDGDGGLVYGARSCSGREGGGAVGAAAHEGKSGQQRDRAEG
jgi:hypothetical protein